MGTSGRAAERGRRSGHPVTVPSALPTPRFRRRGAALSHTPELRPNSRAPRAARAWPSRFAPAAHHARTGLEERPANSPPAPRVRSSRPTCASPAPHPTRTTATTRRRRRSSAASSRRASSLRPVPATGWLQHTRGCIASRFRPRSRAGPAASRSPTARAAPGQAAVALRAPSASPGARRRVQGTGCLTGYSATARTLPGGPHHPQP